MTILTEFDWCRRCRDHAGAPGAWVPTADGGDRWLSLIGDGAWAEIYPAPGDPLKVVRVAPIADRFLDYALLLAVNPPQAIAKAPRIHDVFIDRGSAVCLVDRLWPAPIDDAAIVRQYLLDDIHLRHVPRALREDAAAIRLLTDWLRTYVTDKRFDCVPGNFMTGPNGLVLNDPLPGGCQLDAVVGLIACAAATGRYPGLMPGPSPAPEFALQDIAPIETLAP